MSLPLCPHLGPQYVLVTYSHNVAFGPLLPFPLLLFLGGMVSHPAETTRLSLCYRSVVCSGSGGGGGRAPTTQAGGKAARGSTTTTAVPPRPPWLPLRIPERKLCCGHVIDLEEIRLPAIAVETLL